MNNKPSLFLLSAPAIHDVFLCSNLNSINWIQPCKALYTTAERRPIATLYSPFRELLDLLTQARRLGQLTTASFYAHVALVGCQSSAHVAVLCEGVAMHLRRQHETGSSISDCLTEDAHKHPSSFILLVFLASSMPCALFI